MEFTNNSLNSPKVEKLNIDTLIIPQGLSIHEKNHDQKISCYCPFKGLDWAVGVFCKLCKYFASMVVTPLYFLAYLKSVNQNHHIDSILGCHEAWAHMQTMPCPISFVKSS